MKFTGTDRKVVMVEKLADDDQVEGYNVSGRYWAKFYELEDDETPLDDIQEMSGGFYDSLEDMQEDIDEWLEEDL